MKKQMINKETVKGEGINGGKNGNITILVSNFHNTRANTHSSLISLDSPISRMIRSMIKTK